jgi:hypothetical protein
MSIIDELKSRARALHRAAAQKDPAALDRLRSIPELKELDDAEVAARARRRHCLAALARELGFAGWPHAVAVLEGAEASDYGTLLYPNGASAHWNVWSASYDEARAIREEHGGYLLAYKRHFFIVDRYFVETIGLDPDDPDWDDIGRDWARPLAPEARTRLYEKLIRARPEALG